MSLCVYLVFFFKFLMNTCHGATDIPVLDSGDVSSWFQLGLLSFLKNSHRICQKSTPSSVDIQCTSSGSNKSSQVTSMKGKCSTQSHSISSSPGRHLLSRCLNVSLLEKKIHVLFCINL